jgi:hypothetical protein
MSPSAPALAGRHRSFSAKRGIDPPARDGA